MAKLLGGLQKVVTIIKAKGEPDQVTVKHTGKPGDTELPLNTPAKVKPIVVRPKLKAEPPQPEPIPQPVLPKSSGIRITPRRPKIGR